VLVVLDLVGLSSASEQKQLTCAIYKNLRATTTKREKLREVQCAITPIPTFALSGSSLRCTHPRRFPVTAPLQPRFHELLSSQASSWMVKYHSSSKKLHFSYTKIVYDLKNISLVKSISRTVNSGVTKMELSRRGAQTITPLNNPDLDSLANHPAFHRHIYRFRQLLSFAIAFGLPRIAAAKLTQTRDSNCAVKARNFKYVIAGWGFPPFVIQIKCIQFGVQISQKFF
jgi:hypothetical protein